MPRRNKKVGVREMNDVLSNAANSILEEVKEALDQALEEAAWERVRFLIHGDDRASWWLRKKDNQFGLMGFHEYNGKEMDLFVPLDADALTEDAEFTDDPVAWLGECKRIIVDAFDKAIGRFTNATP